MAACSSEVRCAKERSITSLYDLVPGHHIKTNWILYDHHMIVVEVISKDRIRIIHKRKNMEPVAEEEVSYRPEDLTLLVYNSPFSAVEIVRRARERIGQTYNLVSANCEHFVTEVRTGLAVSLQVETVGQWATIILETVRLWATNILETVGLIAVGLCAIIIAVGIFAMAAIRVLGATRSNQKESPGGHCWTVGNYWCCNGSHHIWRN